MVENIVIAPLIPMSISDTGITNGGEKDSRQELKGKKREVAANLVEKTLKKLV